MSTTAQPDSTTPPPGDPQAGYVSGGPLRVWLRETFDSLRVRDFRLFFVGQGVSLTGTWVRRTALGWLIYELTGSRAMLGTVMGLALLPLFVLSPAAGALADRVDKRRIIILSQVLASLTSAVIAVLVLTGKVEPWHLLVLSTLSGVAFAFEVPARQAFVVEMVGRERLRNAVALNSALVNLSRIVGPAVGGLLMGTIGIGFCFAVDAASYLAVLATLFALHVVPTPPRPRMGSHLQEMLEGFREVHRNRRVRTLLLLLFLMGVFGWSFQTLMPAIAQDLLHLNELHYGLLLACFGAGAIVGALYVAGRSGRRNPRNVVFGGVWLMCAGAYGVALSRSPWPMGAALVVAGFGAVMFLSTSNTLVQMGVDDSIRGRIMGIWALGFGGSLPLGAFLSGWTAELISPYATIALFSSVLLLGSIAVRLRLPKRRPPGARTGDDAPEASEAAQARTPA